ncbi:MAG: DNA repair protein RecN [Spirochaetales bacterium]|nr:DNA repair protein RecN [Spirochaetales bacterium]
MLEELSIKNFALIEKLSIEFHSGLNILSGETGAGKSIIIGALGLILGSKGDISLIRTGCSESQVSCVIKIPEENEAFQWLSEHSMEPEDGRIIIRRVLRRTGRGSVFIQSVTASRKELEELTSFIFDLHGQHSHQSLLSIENQRKLLDRYAGVEERVRDLRLNFTKLSELGIELSEMVNSEDEIVRERELLSHSIEEIERAELREGEEENLVKERSILTQHEKLLDYFEICRNSLSDNSGGVLSALRIARSSMDNLAENLEDLKPVSVRLDDAFYEIEDIFESLRQFQDSIDFSPGRLEECEDRLQLIHRLQKKFGESIEAVLAYKEKSKDKLVRMEHVEGDRTALEEEISLLEKMVLSEAGEISKIRIEMGKTLENRIGTNLKPMGMPKAVFKIEVSQRENSNGKPSCGSSGLDKVEFLISPNEGEPLKPLKSIASGGELSRIMLSIKSVLAESDSVLSLIFDEIDTGIGGEVALSVGDHLSEIGNHRQILCITHLASIAVHADNHIKVVKITEKGRTITTVEQVSESGRVLEIARMLSGDSSGSASLDHARELLEKYGVKSI